MYTYNRTDDAYINMEIIRNIWKKIDLLKDVIIIHAFNGQKEWWSEKYLEDELLYLDNPGHFAGAEILINEGVKTFQEKYPDIDYVIVLASDTWLVKPEYVEEIIIGMEREEKYFATAVWGTKMTTDIWKKGAAMDFNIFDLKWATKSDLFPIQFREFAEKYTDLFFYNNQTVYLEIVFMVRFRQAISRSIKISSDNILKAVAESHVYRMKEREPVHIYGKENTFFKNEEYRRTMYWPKIGLITHHDPVPKQKILKEWKLELGKHADTFLTAKDVSYYNRGLDKNVFTKNGKKIGYGD